jgi:hypothetical protein
VLKTAPDIIASVVDVEVKGEVTNKITFDSKREMDTW